ncbi:recombination intermediate processing DNA-dependent ATPase [Erysipelotrichaceae bacterium]|nr:recombination intermediate processing DNA-dependent ATPase [Erysipelotrichaceae bacterium]
MDKTSTQPLAERIRPDAFELFFGITALYEKYPFLKAMVEHNFYRSAIFYGPSGSGKTTFARILVKNATLPVIDLNAVFCAKQDIINAITQSQQSPLIVVMDEIHRLSKDKQELLLPVIESGAIILFGLTTVHPNTSLPASIRSRLSIYYFEPCTTQAIISSLKRALATDALLQSLHKTITGDALSAIATLAGGDIRFALNTLEEVCFTSTTPEITTTQLQLLHEKTHLAVDNTKNHYDLLSALQKSIRGSDADAAIYWLLRLAENNDISEISRRLIIIAFEDVALGNPAICSRVLDATHAAELVGFPEAIYPLGYITVELALSPKSRTITDAIALTRTTIQKSGLLEVPEILKLRTIDRTQFYDYSNKKAWHSYQYLPEKLQGYHFFDFSKEYRSGKFEEQFQRFYQKRKG